MKNFEFWDIDSGILFSKFSSEFTYSLFKCPCLLHLKLEYFIPCTRKRKNLGLSANLNSLESPSKISPPDSYFQAYSGPWNILSMQSWNIFILKTPNFEVTFKLVVSAFSNGTRKNGIFNPLIKSPDFKLHSKMTCESIVKWSRKW